MYVTGTVTYLLLIGIGVQYNLQHGPVNVVSQDHRFLGTGSSGGSEGCGLGMGNLSRLALPHSSVVCNKAATKIVMKKSFNTVYLKTALVLLLIGSLTPSGK